MPGASPKSYCLINSPATCFEALPRHSPETRRYGCTASGDCARKPIGEPNFVQAQRLIHKVLEEDPAFAQRKQVPVPVRVFALMPLEHSENRENQKLLIESMAIASVSRLAAFSCSAGDESLSFAARLPHAKAAHGVCVGAPGGGGAVWALPAPQQATRACQHP